MLDTNELETAVLETSANQSELIDCITKLLHEKNAVLVAHYYVEGVLQTLAQNTGGFVGDSLEMARFGKHTDKECIIVAGVRFMGETAKILSPEKKVYVLDLNATCSLDEGCKEIEFKQFCEKYPDREVVVYANTSAKVKAIADWMVTSSSAVNVINYLTSQGKKIIWAPDKHLGNYIKERTHADMILWDSSCVVHDAFKADGIAQIKALHSDARVLVHPESPREVIALADTVGSTTQLIAEVQKAESSTYIIATDNGIFHKMREVNPKALLIEAPSRGESADCESCAHCEWMAMNDLYRLEYTLRTGNNEIVLDGEVIQHAQHSIHNLLEFTKK